MAWETGGFYDNLMGDMFSVLRKNGITSMTSPKKQMKECIRTRNAITRKAK